MWNRFPYSNVKIVPMAPIINKKWRMGQIFAGFKVTTHFLLTASFLHGNIVSESLLTYLKEEGRGWKLRL
jgi:hypothetical protein